MDDIYRFYMRCYRKFNTVPKTQKENNNDICNQRNQLTRITQSSLTSPATSLRTGTFPKVCLFCYKERQKIKGKEQKLTNAETVIFEECRNSHF